MVYILCNVCLFDLFLYVPVNIFSAMSGLVFLGWTSTKQRIKCLAQGHDAVPLVRLRPATPQSLSQAPYHWATKLLLCNVITKVRNAFIREFLTGIKNNLSQGQSKGVQAFFQQIWEKTSGQNPEKMIDLTSKLGEINDIEHNKGSKIYPQSQVILDCIMLSIPLKHKCLSNILIWVIVSQK